MERSEYYKLDRLEGRMWWFAASHRNLLMLAARQARLHARGRPILDAGCGTGGFLAQMAASYPDRALIGLDVDPLACQRATAKSAQPVCVGSINALPFLKGAFSAVFSVDVLCHNAVDERSALLQFCRCLADDGWLVVNLPAYSWMRSQHDAAVHNIRRYTAASLRQLLEATGFRMVYATYWNTILFPLMVIKRKLIPAHSNTTSDVEEYSRLIEALCRAATTFETALLRKGLRLPFGGSVIAIATKGGTTRGPES
jgi:SAM-dependent methyltransferase